MHSGLIIFGIYLAAGLAIFGLAAYFDLRKRAKEKPPSTDDIISELQVINETIRQGRIKAGTERIDELIARLSNKDLREAA